MSYWSYISGTIEVEPMGRTQAEKTYILQTVLDHLPVVEGSERDMQIYMNQKNGVNSSCSCDEFGLSTDKAIGYYGARNREKGFFSTQDCYILTLSGSLRDCVFEDALKEIEKWLVRLSKRVQVTGILVQVQGQDKKLLFDNYEPFLNMFEDCSWFADKNPKTYNWCEYLMWERGEAEFPKVLEKKYNYR